MIERDANHQARRRDGSLIEQVERETDRDMIGRETDAADVERHADHGAFLALGAGDERARNAPWRSEEHTSELQSIMRISYDVICLQKYKHILHKTVMK